MTVSDFSDSSVNPDYIARQLRRRESQKSELEELRRRKGWSEVISFLWNAGATVANFFQVPIPQISAGLIQSAWEKVQQWLAKEKLRSATS